MTKLHDLLIQLWTEWFSATIPDYIDKVINYICLGLMMLIILAGPLMVIGAVKVIRSIFSSKRGFD